MSDLHLSNTTAADLDYVLAAECHEENRPYVTLWSRQQHLEAIDNPDVAHLIVRHQTIVGYVIVAGLLDANQSIELRRIVITEKGKGYGKATLEIIKKLAFETYQAHRLWLDVKTYNDRAQAIYKAAGFTAEGTLRECLKTEDRYESLIIMSILRQEYPTERRFP